MTGNQMTNPYLHEVAITAIIIKEEKYLITRRALTKKRFPGKWTVPGEVQLQPEETDQFVWVSLEEAKAYDLLDGIYDELLMVDNKRKGLKEEWKRHDVS